MRIQEYANDTRYILTPQQAFNELGHHFFRKGNFADAHRQFMRVRDFCSLSAHWIDRFMNLIKVAFHLQSLSTVPQHVNQAEQQPELDPTTSAKLKMAMGLSLLDSRKYRAAARKLLEVDGNIGNKYDEVLGLNDMTIYVVLCALAEFERSDLRTKLVNNPNFRTMTENNPLMLEIVENFYYCKYGAALTAIEGLKNEFLLDIHLHDHVNTLLTKIRARAVALYITPFFSVDMQAMATEFRTDVAAVEAEVAALIVDGAIPARIDSQAKRIYAKNTDERTTTFDKALDMGKKFQKSAKFLILRVNVIRNDFIVKGKK